MPYAISPLTVNVIPELLATMSSWQPVGGCASGLHPGDIGWNLRQENEQSLLAVTIWRDGADRICAVALADEPGELRLTTDPTLRHEHEQELTATLAADLAERRCRPARRSSGLSRAGAEQSWV